MIGSFTNKSLRGMKWLLPEVQTMAYLFWGIISLGTYGFAARIGMMIIQHFVLLTLASRLVRSQLIINDDFLNIKIIGPSGTATSETVLITIIVLVSFYTAILLSLVYMYKTLKRRDKAGKTRTTAIVRCLNIFHSFFLGAFQELFGLLTQFIVCVSFYWIQYSNAKAQESTVYSEQSAQLTSNNLTIIIMLSFLQMYLFFFNFIERTFMKLQFRSHSFITARPNSGLLDYHQPLFSILSFYLCLKPSNSFVERILFLSLLTVLQLCKVAFSFSSFNYYNNKLRMADQILSIVLASSLITFLLISIDNTLGQGLRNIEFIAILWIFILAGLAGIAILMKRKRDKKITVVMSNWIEMRESLKDQSLVESAVYRLIEDMLSTDAKTHSRFLSLMLLCEESLQINNQESQSYFLVMSRLLRAGSEDDDEQDPIGYDGLYDFELGSVADDPQSFKQTACNSGLRVINHPSDKPYQKNYSHSIPVTALVERAEQKSNHTPKASDGGDHRNSGQGNHMSGFSSYEDTSSAARHKALAKNPTGRGGSFHVSSIVQAVKARKSFQVTVDEESGVLRFEPDGMNHLLVDIFKNDMATKNLNDDRFFQGQGRYEEIMATLKMKVSHNISEEEVLKLVKIRFFYEEIATKCSALFPNSILLMFIKALLAIDFLHNKYLALTTLTHISLLAQKTLGYIERVQTKISEQYFVEAIQSESARATRSSEEGLSKWSDQEKPLEPDVLLEHSLNIDRVLGKLRTCCGQIALFWQLYNAKSLSPQQLSQFLDLTVKLGEHLQEVRNHAAEVENYKSFYSRSYQLVIALAQFYTLVLRDQNQGIKIAMRIESFNTLGFSNIFQRENPQDDIGVLIVDGNFDQWGRILYGNNQILSALGYRIDDVANKLIHVLMPRVIADAHNNFWRNFAVVGEPKVLDRVRFLFVKDSKGYIQPLKLFIKFQYTVQFGYCFLGIFKKPMEVVFTNIDVPVPVVDTFQMICNGKGEILEISQSCRDLFQLTPQIIESLKIQLQEGLLLSVFNSVELHFSELDFDSNNSIFFRSVLLDFQHLAKLIRGTEAYEEVEESSVIKRVNRSQSSITNQQFRAQMKIIKEEYGNSTIQAPLAVYYVIFSEGPMIENVTIGGSPKNCHQSVDSTGLLNSSTNGLGLAKIIEGTQEELFSNQSVYNCQEEAPNQSMNKMPSSLHDSSAVASSQFKFQSQSSSCSTNASDTRIRAVDEGVDDQKSPRVIVGLRISISILIVVLLILAIIQFALNSKVKVKNTEFELIMLESFEAQEFITELRLLSRTYLNINLGLEATSSMFVPDRKLIIKQIGTKLISLLRKHIQLLKTFFVDQEQFYQTKEILQMYSLMANHSVQLRELPKLYAVGLWLVNLEEIFEYSHFNSTIGTFLFTPNNSTQITAFDQVAFFNSQNGEEGLSDIFTSMIGEEKHLIQGQIDYGIFANKLFSLLSSSLIIVSAAAIVYMALHFVYFKRKILRLFDRLTPEQIRLQEDSAVAFQEYLTTGSESELLRLHGDTMKQPAKGQSELDVSSSSKSRKPNLAMTLIRNEMSRTNLAVQQPNRVVLRRQSVLPPNPEEIRKHLMMPQSDISKQNPQIQQAPSSIVLVSFASAFISGQSQLSAITQQKQGHFQPDPSMVRQGQTAKIPRESRRKQLKFQKPQSKKSNISSLSPTKSGFLSSNSSNMQRRMSIQVHQPSTFKVQSNQKKNKKSVQIVVSSIEDSKQLYEEEKQMDISSSQRSTQRKKSPKSLKSPKKKKTDESFSESQPNLKDIMDQELEADPDCIQQREVTRHLKMNRIKTIWKMIPLAVLITSVLILYFIVQYLLFENQSRQIQNNSEQLTLLLRSLSCQDEIMSQIRNIEVSNNTQYQMKHNMTNGDNFVLNIASRESFERSGLNESFIDCLRINSEIQQWLQTSNNGEFYLSGKGNYTLCSFLQQAQNTSTISGTFLSRESCEAIYQGALSKNPLQSTSIFLQDAIYGVIKFLQQGKSTGFVRDEKIIREAIGSLEAIELIDAHTFFQQNALRMFFQKVLRSILDNQDSSTPIIALFGVFLSGLLIAAVFMHWLLFARLRRLFWDYFLLVQLLPRDDLDKAFIKNINDLLLRV